MKSTGVMRGTGVAAVLLLGAVLMAACGGSNDASGGNGASNQTGITDPAVASGNTSLDSSASSTDAAGAEASASGAPEASASDAESSGSAGTAEPAVASPESAGDSGQSQPQQAVEGAGQNPDTSVVANPDSAAVLINKQFGLPEDYEPADLVYPDVPFTFSEKIEKRMMRKEAAAALEDMFAAAKKDGIYLAGVSGYRSYERQKTIFENYVKKDGEEKARTYSAYPGYSEHETGLAIDVSGSDGKCAAEDCFGGTPEAEWIAEHAPEYGYIVRYPEGKEDITGYKYEPWHIRYVGKEIAADIAKRNITLEEYYDAVPVSK
ncbi:M15 family metallopeptidase [Paenibacillus pinistramenti]|uniref:M15 family metallopeptidase n=1 Tax=Paenibacillus pinistramenti TaxID=1768003 RepID=UPI001EF0F7D1|nr:M15 family metallopeptidase [Paenibacillus pinistramenti]